VVVFVLVLLPLLLFVVAAALASLLARSSVSLALPVYTPSSTPLWLL